MLHWHFIEINCSLKAFFPLFPELYVVLLVRTKERYWDKVEEKHQKHLDDYLACE